MLSACVQTMEKLCMFRRKISGRISTSYLQYAKLPGVGVQNPHISALFSRFTHMGFHKQIELSMPVGPQVFPSFHSAYYYHNEVIKRRI